MKKIFFTLFLIGACGQKSEDNGNSDSSNQNKKNGSNFVQDLASGKIANEDWKMTYGTARKVKNSFDIDLESGSVPADACSPRAVSKKNRVSFFMPLEKGTIDFTPLTKFWGIVFSSSKEERNGVSEMSQIGGGTATIEEINDHTISGKISSKSDDSNFVEGKFVVTICP